MKIKSSNLYGGGSSVEVIVPIPPSEIDSDSFGNDIDIDLSNDSGYYITNITGNMTFNFINAPIEDKEFDILLNTPSGYEIDLTGSSKVAIDPKGNDIESISTNAKTFNILKVKYSVEADRVFIHTILTYDDGSEPVTPPSIIEVNSGSLGNNIDIDLTDNIGVYITNITGNMTFDFINPPLEDVVFDIELSSPNSYDIDVTGSTKTVYDPEGNAISDVTTNSNNRNIISIKYSVKSDSVYLFTKLVYS